MTSTVSDQIAVDSTDDSVGFWRNVISLAAEVGPEPMILVPFSLGETISAASYGYMQVGLDGFNVSRSPELPNRGDTFYMGTIDGVHVYSVDPLANRAILFSSQKLQRLDYAALPGSLNIADFEFIDGDGSENSNVRLRFAQTVYWNDQPIIELKFPSVHC